MGADATSCCPETVVGLPGFTVIATGEYGGELELLVETSPVAVALWPVRVRAKAHDRREHILRDAPVGDRASVLVWWKRIWRCPNPGCETRTWTEQLPLAAPRSAVTQRAKVWLARRVGADAHTVASLARELGLGWVTVMRAVIEVGTPLIDDPARLQDVRGLGVDEHAWQHANAHRGTQFATGIVDRPARLLDVVPGRSGTVYGNRIAQRDHAWRARVRVAALDPFRGYLNALRTHLPDATHVLDAFHVTKLAFTAVDEVRRRVQQATLGQRGHKGDPLYEIRRLLRRRVDRLSPTAIARLDAAGRRHAEQTNDTLLDCPVPEVCRLGRTLALWRKEYLAYFDTNRTSNGPTKAVNLLVEKIRCVGHGYRNWSNY